MLDISILALLAAAGYMGWSAAWALAGAAAMAAGAWWRKLRLLRQHPQVPLSSKMTTYLVVGIVLDVLLALAAITAGRALRWWLAP